MTELPGLAALLPWDSQFFGRRIGSISKNSLSPSELDQILAWAAGEQIDCLYFLSDEASGSSLHPVLDAGFRPVDLRVSLVARLAKLQAHSIEKPGFSLANEADIPALREIARYNHVDSRFYADLQFERSKADELYALWIEKSLKDPATRVFTYKPEGTALGYVTLSKTSTGAESIGLAGVARSEQGKGIGSMLIQSALNALLQEGAQTVQVITQGRNTRAIQLYEKSGFRIRAIQAWFHKWF